MSLEPLETFWWVALWVGKDAQGAGRGTPALPAPLPKLGFTPSVKPTQGVKEQLNLSRTVCIKTRHTC